MTRRRKPRVLPGSFDAPAPDPPPRKWSNPARRTSRQRSARRRETTGQNPTAISELADAEFVLGNPKGVREEFDQMMIESHGREGESMADYLAAAEAEAAEKPPANTAMHVMNALLLAAILGMVYLFLRKHLKPAAPSGREAPLKRTDDGGQTAGRPAGPRGAT